MSWKNHYSKLVYWGSIIECIYAIRYPVTWWKWWSSGGWNVYVWKTASLLFSNLPLRFCMVHPRRPRGSQSGQVKRRDERFQTWTEEPLGTDSHRTISKRSRECWFLIGHKNALYYCAQLANSISWVLFVSSYTTAIISPQLPGSFTKLS